jgi:hypothetical protein
VSNSDYTIDVRVDANDEGSEAEIFISHADATESTFGIPKE